MLLFVGKRKEKNNDIFNNKKLIFLHLFKFFQYILIRNIKDLNKNKKYQ